MTDRENRAVDDTVLHQLLRSPPHAIETNDFAMHPLSTHSRAFVWGVGASKGMGHFVVVVCPIN